MLSSGESPQVQPVNLTGKVAVVTGASRGVGQRIALRLARHGAAVALLARSQAGLSETEQLIAKLGFNALCILIDLGHVEAVNALPSAVEQGLGVPSILINAAGIFGPLGLVKDTDPKVWIETMQVNTIGTYLTCRAFVGGMIDRGWGRIVNVTSAAALHEPGPANSAYGTSKAAVNQFTRHFASELMGNGVTANVIHPGDVKTAMWAEIQSASKRLGNAADSYRKWAQWVQETGGDDPEKAADLVMDLMSEDASGTTGQFLWIKDGLQSPIPSWGRLGEDQPWRRREPKR